MYNQHYSSCENSVIYKRYFRYMYQQPDPHFSDGSFSAVSKPIFATKYSFCSIFRDLQDSQTFAPLQIQNLQNFCNFVLEKFGKFSRFLQIFLKSAEISSFSLRISRKFVGIPGNPRKLTEIRKLLRKFAKFCEIRLDFANFGMKFW